LAALGLMVVTWGTAAILGYYAYMVQ
jgi:hypothetical protein